MRRQEELGAGGSAVGVESAGDTGRIKLLGEIDHSAVRQLDQAVHELLDGGATKLVFDFADLSFFDSACISALVRAHSQAGERGGEIELVNVNPYARRILDLTGLSDVFALSD
ncbi:STAS domain-containing protein [Amycolatopsis sp.]|uniref:STAS domain-containing protein n=1 Tax=Amycolatopsis sp. TaxID=37632 RepID=UPI002C405205|nr:STAS domain-containing protein [Amycolatopsis sp.]HVV14745.1 STAS domain-containing protein [Amycolatopsis sp.]